MVTQSDRNADTADTSGVEFHIDEDLPEDIVRDEVIPHGLHVGGDLDVGGNITATSFRGRGQDHAEWFEHVSTSLNLQPADIVGINMSNQISHETTNKTLFGVISGAASFSGHCVVIYMAPSLVLYHRRGSGT